jgi:phosphatidate cytidylyltransferase
LIPVVLLVLYLGGPVFLIFLAFFALAATAEFARMLGFSLRTSLLASLVLGLPYFLNFYFAFIPWHVYFMLYLLISASILFVFGYTRVSFLQGAGLIFGGLYVPVLASTLALVRYLDDGMLYTLAVLLLTWGTDSGAFFLGKALGKKKLAPAISPNKSWAGAVGGLITGVMIALAFGILMDGNVIHFALWGVIASAMCQIGDLAESAFKRHAGVKDSGSMLPGHGGFLDRIDSLLFTATISYIFFGMVI